MIRCALKNFNIVLLILFLTSCANINVVEIDQDLLRVDKFDNKDQFVKSYFKKFHQETGQWLPAICNYDGVNIINLKSNECEFTDMSLHMIRIAKEESGVPDTSAVDNKNSNTEQENNNNQNEEEDEEEEGFFDFGCDENCE